MTSSDNTAPVLYSFRRCPYAIRARLAIAISQSEVELREVVLKDKPEQMITISPKATVPVLHLIKSDQVLDESDQIMLWALGNNDPENWLGHKQEKISPSMEWVAANDGEFKHWLDRYKYVDRYPEETEEQYRDKAMVFIYKLESKLAQSKFLLGEDMSLADAAVLPFVRQFAHVNKPWFDLEVPTNVQKWLAGFLQSELFLSVMEKLPQWHAGDMPHFINRD